MNHIKRALKEKLNDWEERTEPLTNGTKCLVDYASWIVPHETFRHQKFSKSQKRHFIVYR